MAGRRRGARSGRGWDAAPPRAGAAASGAAASSDPTSGAAKSSGARSGRRAGTGRTTEHAAQPGPPADPAERARQICLRQLAVRPRTRAELATALRRGGISDEIAAQVLDRYGEVGMIDDAAFARAWVSSRHHGRGLARRALASELRQRGVAPDAVGEAVAELDADTEAATARALVERKLRTTTGQPEAVFRRLAGMLARKGYPAGLAIRVVKDAMAAQSAEAAEFAEWIDPDALADAAEHGAMETDAGAHGVMETDAAERGATQQADGTEDLH
jgi:regulatory protein